MEVGGVSADNLSWPHGLYAVLPVAYVRCVDRPIAQQDASMRCMLWLPVACAVAGAWIAQQDASNSQ